jgi:riboflavin kinase/FMN adenylyltransferase
MTKCRVLRLDELRVDTARRVVTRSRWPSGQHRRIEAQILDVDTDLYGRRVGLEFARRLRGMVRVDDVDSLVAQM